MIFCFVKTTGNTGLCDFDDTVDSPGVGNKVQLQNEHTKRAADTVGLIQGGLQECHEMRTER